MKMNVRTVEVVIVPEGEPIFSERAITVRIVDEAAGEFIQIEQNGDDVGQTLSFNPDEWNLVNKTVVDMIKQIEKYEQKENK